MEVAVLSQVLRHDFSSELNGVTSEEVVTLNQILPLLRKFDEK